MFGLLKENILSNLEKTHLNGDEKTFKKEFVKFFKVIKENKELKEFYEIYDLFNKVNFDDLDVAKEFIEESVKYLNTFDKSKIKLLGKLSENTNNLPQNSIERKLDQLLFNKNLSIKDRAILKIDLAKSITNKKIDANYLNHFDKLNQKINENLSKLSDEEKEVLELFVENDTKKIQDFYHNLIKETENMVENKILGSKEIDVIKTLVEVKKRLNDLKAETPTLQEVEKIYNLKNSF